ncbi:MAG: hypothetical protein ABL931_17740 [Usitatibacteraceae bacterium]
MFRLLLIASLVSVSISLASLVPELRAEEKLPTADELKSGYRQNLIALGDFRVVYSLQEQYFEPYRQRLQEICDQRHQELQRSKEISTANIERLSVATKHVNDFVPSVIALPTVEAWRSGTSIQIRLSSKAPEATVSLTRESIEATLHNTTIISKTNKMTHWHTWGGAETSQPKLSIVSACPLNQISLPPMLSESVIPESLRHQLEFVYRAGNRLTVYGRETIDGKELLIVDVSNQLQLAPPSEFNRRLRVEQVYRSWIDENAGYWPRRMSYLTRYYFDDVLVDNPVKSTNGYPPIVDDIVIERHSNGAFFPSSGKTREWRLFPDAKWPTMEDVLVRGKERPVSSSVLIKEKSWSCQIFPIDKDSCYDLLDVVPVGTPVWKDGEFRVLDDQRELILAVIPDELRPTPWTQRRLMFFITFGICITVLAAWTLRHFRRRSQ